MLGVADVGSGDAGGGSRLASGSTDCTLRIWDVERRSSVELRGHAAQVDSLAWHPTQPDRLATASSDRTVKQWDVRSGKCVASCATPGENILIAWRPQGDALVFGNRDDVLAVLDAASWKLLASPAPHRFGLELNEMAFAPDGAHLVLCTAAGTVELLRWPRLERARTLHAHTAPCFCIDFDPTGRHFAVGSADALASVWDLAELLCVRTCARMEFPVRCVSFSHDGALLACSGEDAHIDIAAVATGAQLHALPLRQAVNAAVWHPRQYLLAYGGDAHGGSSSGADAPIRIFGLPPAP